MVRFLLCFSVIGIFAFNEGYAMDQDSSSESSSESASSTPKKPSTPKNRKRSLEKSNTPSPKRIKVEKVPIFPPLVTDSPLTAERKYFLIAKLELGKEEYSQCAKDCLKQKDPDKFLPKNKRKNEILSPEARGIFTKLPNNYWRKKIHFKGRVVYQASLYDPYAIIEGKKTNLELMKEGRAPLIQSGNKIYRVEIHHLMNKDPKKKNPQSERENPVVEVSSRCHMGPEDRMILEIDHKVAEMRVVDHTLTKEEAVGRRKPHQIIVSNVLHFLIGKSVINRTEFDAWRQAYWRYCAEEIEKGNFVGKEDLPALVSPIKFFSGSSSEESSDEGNKENLPFIIAPKKLFVSSPPAKKGKKDKKEILIVKEKLPPISSPKRFLLDSFSGEDSEAEDSANKENPSDPLDDLFISITPPDELFSISLQPSPFEVKVSKAKSPLEVRNLNTVKRELFPG